jgi:hypothetical protein
MANSRPNTLIVKLDNLPRKPAAGIIHDFVQEKLQLTYETVKSFQISYSQKRVYIELNNEVSAENFAAEQNEKHGIICDNEQYKVSLDYYDECKIVRLFDLAPSTSNRDITQKLSEYGSVRTITNDVWGKDLPYANKENGIKIIKMKLFKPIPSYITINGETTYVTHQGQISTCRWCRDPVHFGQSCAENRSKKTVNDRMTFASTVDHGIQQQATAHATEQMEIVPSSDEAEVESIPESPTTPTTPINFTEQAAPTTSTTQITEKSSETVSTMTPYQIFRQQQQSQQNQSTSNDSSMFQKATNVSTLINSSNLFDNVVFAPPRPQTSTVAMDAETSKTAREPDNDDIEQNIQESKVARTSSAERRRKKK